MLLIGVILGEAGDPERLPPVAAMPRRPTEPEVWIPAFSEYDGTLDYSAEPRC